MKKSLSICLLTIVVFLSNNSISLGQDLLFTETNFNFGTVGIDYQVQHRFKLVNNSDQSYKVDSFNVSCDCTTVYMSDSVIAPNDTVFFDLSFETKNYYGPTNKSFKVFTNHKVDNQFKIYYQSNIGQWLNGLVPNCESLFFIPGKKSKNITLLNNLSNNISISNYFISDSTFLVNFISKNASKNKLIEIEVIPIEKLGRATYDATLTLEINLGKADKIEIVSFPIKIVRY